MLAIFRDPWLEDRETRQREQRAKLLGEIGIMGAGFTALFLILSQTPFHTIGIGGLILMAATAAGAGLGFLFSVPRVLSVGAAGAPGAKAAMPVRLLTSNTNLERISEWLTTMIVGVGLSQLTSIGEGVRLFTAFLANGQQSRALATAGPFILVVGLVSGFIFLYLYTRLFLSPLFLHVEKMMSDVGDEENLIDTAELKEIAGKLAEKRGSSFMRKIAETDRLTFEQTVQVLSALLYEPDGYKQVLQIGEKLKDTHASEMGSYWFIMAAANGQRFSGLVEAGSDTERLAARQAVLDASRRAVMLDPQYKGYLAELTRETGKDDDLKDFAADKEFLRIIRGRS